MSVNPSALQLFASLDARQPWYAPYAAWLGAGRWALQDGSSAAAALSRLAEQGGTVPRFVAASSLPPGEAYEAFVARTASVPTRDNLHDFFNGLVWLRFTRAKQRLNELQAAEIARSGVGGRRGALRDGLTLFDENGAVLAAPPVLWEALVARDWRRLFVDLRPLWRQANLVVFGHALLEKLASPRKDLTAHVWRAPAPLAAVELDGWLAAQMTADRVSGKPLTPLPVLGTPGWWPDNQNFSFYDDSLVFRPQGRPNPETTKPSATSRS